MIDENKDALLVMKAHRNLPEGLFETCSTVQFGRCLCGMAALFGKIVHSETLGPQHITHYKEMSPHGHYCVPIQAAGKVLGVINLYVKEGHKRDPKEEEFLAAVANTVAGIIERKKSETEKTRLQDQLMQYEKLSALGRLTSNVAHEIRNPLTSLGGFARRLYKKVADSSREKEYCEVIISEVNRLERILDNVLTFSKNISLNIRHEDVNEILEQILEDYETVCAQKHITVQRSLNHVPLIPIDKEQIKKAVNNIISNAIDSMPKGGNLILATGEEFLNSVTYVVIKITDQGEGIAEDKICFVFEPFFSTKAVGTLTGTGLGLSISRKIIEEHCGFIKAESSVGKGSSFSLYFPYQQPEDVQKLQCWQYLKCGMDNCADKHCPAYPNYGRVCWAIAGTYCSGKVEGTYAQKIKSCKTCPFYHTVTSEIESDPQEE
jgi:signal transduction histidine kinase